MLLCVFHLDLAIEATIGARTAPLLVPKLISMYLHYIFYFDNYVYMGIMLT